MGIISYIGYIQFVIFHWHFGVFFNCKFIFNLSFFKLSPALWFHNVISEEFGVGVNVFWKHLSSECYDKTDTYGNKDPTASAE